MDIFLSTLKWSAVVGAAALVLALVKSRLDRRYSAKWRYWAWLVLAALLLAAPWTALLPEFDAPEPPVVIEVPRVQATVGENTGVRFQGQRPGETGQPPLVASREIRLDDLPTRSELQSAYESQGVSVDTDTLLPLLWAVGAVCFALWHLVGTLWFGRKARRWSRPAGEGTAAIYAATAADVGLSRVPALWVSSAVDSPMVLGLLRPRLLLPDEEAGEGELRFILRHELTHYQRRDLWYQLLLLAANALHWFDPLVYLLRREATADLELTCDDAVVAGQGMEARRAYSETLLANLHRQSGLARSALSTHFYGGAKVMKKRFQNILTGGGRKWGGLALALVLVITLVTACALGFRSGAAKSEPLSVEELTEWEAKLNTPEWNIYVGNNAYSDVAGYAPGQQLNAYFYKEEWPEGWEKAVPPPVEELVKEDPGRRVVFITRDQADRFLREHTGLGIDDYPDGFGPGLWTYEEAYDGYIASGMGPVIGVSKVVVRSGVRQGDTVTLEVEPRLSTRGTGNNSWNLTRTLTIVDGKVKSFTSSQEIQVEKLARDAMEEWLRKVESGGARVEGQYLAGFWSNDVDQFEINDKLYTIWQTNYAVQVDDPSKIPGELGLFEYGGWMWQSTSTALVVGKDQDGKVELLEALPYSQWKDVNELTWEEHIAALVSGGDGPTPLTQAELDAWQEKLSDGQYNCFLSQMYTDVRDLPLGEIFYTYNYYQQPNSGGKEIREKLKAKFTQENGYAPDSDCVFISTVLANEFLMESTGLTIRDFVGGFGPYWSYDRETDCWYYFRGDTHYVTPRVTGGVRNGDTTTVEVEIPGGNLSFMTSGTLTIVDGKIKSFTNPVHAAAEQAAWELVENSIAHQEENGAKIVDSQITALWCGGSIAAGLNGETHYIWYLDYLLKPEDMGKVMMAGAMEEVNGWVANVYGSYTPVVIVTADSTGRITGTKTANTSVTGESGYTWEEYITCGEALNMVLVGKLEGWPALNTPLINAVLRGEEAWTQDRDTVALEYLEEWGYHLEPGKIQELKTFGDQREERDVDESVLIQVNCEEGPVTLLMNHVVYPVEVKNAVAKFWQVNSVLWPDGTSQYGGYTGGDYFSYETDIALTEGVSGKVHVSGETYPDGTAGVEQVQIQWKEGMSGGPYFYTRYAILAEKGEDCHDNFTGAWNEAYGLILEDMNGDGYTDIGLLAEETGDQRSYYVWEYHPEETNPWGTYHYAYLFTVSGTPAAG